MKIVNGVDLVYIPRFKKALKGGGENFLRRIYLASELDNRTPQHLAGIFASKEAIMKALSMKPGSWHDIQISHKKNGNPQFQLPTAHLTLHSSSLSISHDGNYVIAQFMAILK